MAHVLRLAIGTFRREGKINITEISYPFWRDIMACDDSRKNLDACTGHGIHCDSNEEAVIILRVCRLTPTGETIAVGDVLHAIDQPIMFSSAMAALEALSDRFLAAGRSLIPDDGSMSEQIDR